LGREELEAGTEGPKEQQRTAVRGSVRKSTYDRNESLCRVHIVPALGRKKLKTLGAQDVAGFYRRKLDEGCTPASVR
jgi:Phage integrase, N-terminal SAM-like domain